MNKSVYRHVLYDNPLLRDRHFELVRRQKAGTISSAQFGAWEKLLSAYTVLADNKFLQDGIKPVAASPAIPQGFFQSQNFFAMSSAPAPKEISAENEAKEVAFDIQKFLEALGPVAEFDPVSALGVTGMLETCLYLAPERSEIVPELTEIRGIMDNLAMDAAQRIGTFCDKDVEVFYEYAFIQATSGLAVHPHANRGAVAAIETAAALRRPSDDFSKVSLWQVREKGNSESPAVKNDPRLQEIYVLQRRLRACLG